MRSGSRPRPSHSSWRCSSARPAWICSSGQVAGVRLTDAALVLVGHAQALLDRADLAEAELAAAAGSVAGRGRIAAFQSGALRLAAPAMHALAREAPALRCELVEAEPEQALPALALGDVDLVLADEWPHRPHRAAGRCRSRRSAPRPGVARPAREPSGRAPARARRASDRAGRRGLDDRPSRHRLGGDDHPDVPAARRVRSRHPPPHQRQRGQPRPRGPGPGRHAPARPRGAPVRIPASPCAASRKVRCTGPSSRPPARPTPSARPSGRSSPPSAALPRASAGPS